MSIDLGSPFEARTGPLNVCRSWRLWSGRFAASAYAPHIDIEVNAIRNAAALIDVSPLFKYHVAGRDASRLVDRVITRDASRVAPGRVIYTPWCDGDGHVIDDGTLHRLDDGSWRWTAAEGQLRWLHLNARGLDVRLEDQTDALAALAVQGPLSRAVLEAAAQVSLADLPYYGRRHLRIGSLEVDLSRTGYTGDLGYEVWVAKAEAVALWDALMEAGAAFALRAAGILALDVVRIEAGLIMAEVDYTSAWHAQAPAQAWSPDELGLGRLVQLDKAVPFVGQAALRRASGTGGPRRRLVGLDLDWSNLDRLFSAHGLPPALPPEVWREPRAVYAAGRQVGRATSGTWSALLKRHVALATVQAPLAVAGTRLEMAWSVEGQPGRLGATVVELPFYDPPQKRGWGHSGEQRDVARIDRVDLPDALGREHLPWRAVGHEPAAVEEHEPGKEA
jgi:aminomethyltransferase